nr:BON domain-containing protein [Micromonospora halophytica]
MPWSHPDGYWSASFDQPEPDSHDLRIEALVAQRLSIDWTTRRQQITVSVQNRVAILAGLVYGEEARRVAAELAWDVPGVFDVCNMLRIADRRRGRR